MRIGLFTERDARDRSGLAAAVDALSTRRPRDCCIQRYAAAPTTAALLQARELIRRAAIDRIDLVHVVTSGPFALIALSVASRFALPMICSFPLTAAVPSWMHRTLIRGLSYRGRRVLATSMAARDTLVRAGISPSKVLLWSPGVDSVTFAPCMRSMALRERWNVSDGRPAVIYAGALSDERGARRLLSLEVELHRTRPMHRLVVAGDGPSRNEMQARCPNAIFLGSVPSAHMPHVLASADLFVCPNEGISTNLAVLEAQASGLPVVVMERGSARERTANQTAVVCRSQADFIVETAALVRTDARRKTMALAARQHALGQRWEVGLTPVYAEYRATVASSRVRPDLEPAFAPQRRRL